MDQLSGGGRRRGVLRGGLDPRPVSAASPAKGRRRRPVAYLVPLEYLAPCQCRACVRRRQSRPDAGLWPAYYVGSVGRSYECYLEANPLAGWINPRERVTLEGREASMVVMSAARAAAEGLHAKRPRRHRPADPPPPAVMVSGCAKCGGLRLRGDRFCAACEAAFVQRVREGQTPEQIAAWLAQGDEAGHAA